MRTLTLCAAALIASITSAAPTGKRQSGLSSDGNYFPLQNGFPNPNRDGEITIQDAAHGTLPNGPPPPALSAEGVTNLKLIALNELFEVAFFTELIFNVTNKVSGYDLGMGHDYMLDSLNAIVNQEELHVLNANGALEHFNQEKIQPCKYDFPVTDFQSAIALAGTFTDVVLGTLQDVNQMFSKNQDDGLVRAVTSVVGNEAEQEGFFRLMQKKRPSSQPFLTTATRDFAFTAIQDFIVEGSCPNIGNIPLKRFKPLTVETKTIPAEDQNIKFSFDMKDAGMFDTNDMRLTYLNGQNQPIVKNFENVKMEGNKVFFEAAFPYDDFLMNGLTIAAVTMGADEFADADKMAEAAIFGPGLIEVD
ncbi:sexual development protein [Stagonosporopsis vannaccii]|nr:sexual development protein [Stagonosporopsis vannaccii]